MRKDRYWSGLRWSKLFDVEIFEDLQDFFFAFGFYEVIERFIIVLDLVPQINDVLLFL